MINKLSNIEDIGTKYGDVWTTRLPRIGFTNMKYKCTIRATTTFNSIYVECGKEVELIKYWNAQNPDIYTYELQED